MSLFSPVRAWATVVLLAGIGCATAVARPKNAELRPANLTTVDALAAAGPIAPRPGMGAIRTECEPSDAEVVVDGTTRGLASDFSGHALLHLEPGTHRIELRKEGYATYRAEVYVSAEVIETIPIKLRRLSAVAADAAPTGAESKESPP